MAPDEVDYVNAHATSTPVGDKGEVRTLRRALGDEVAARTPVSSTKSMHGHCLGAAGGRRGRAHRAGHPRGPGAAHDQPGRRSKPECEGVDHVANEAREVDVRVALSSAFGFGGHNAIIVLGRLEER